MPENAPSHEPLNPNSFHLLSEVPGADEKSVPEVDVDRVFADHNLDRNDIPRIAEQLSSIDAFVVPSGSKYKARVIQKILRHLCPDKQIAIVIVKAPSNVSEQPVGKETVQGAENRMDGANKLITAVKDGQTTGNEEIDALLRGKLGLIGSIENGIRNQALVDQPLQDEPKEFDPSANYVDVAYTTVSLSGVGVSRQVSPPSEAVLFPREDVLAAYNSEGSFATNTVGQCMQKRLESTGIEIDHQDPQAYLTNNKLPRSQQLATVVVKGFVDLVHKNHE